MVAFVLSVLFTLVDVIAAAVVVLCLIEFYSPFLLPSLFLRRPYPSQSQYMLNLSQAKNFYFSSPIYHRAVHWLVFCWLGNSSLFLASINFDLLFTQSFTIPPQIISFFRNWDCFNSHAHQNRCFFVEVMENLVV